MSEGKKTIDEIFKEKETITADELMQTQDWQRIRTGQKLMFFAIPIIAIIALIIDWIIKTI